MYGPDPDHTHPMKGFDRIVFLKNVIRRPSIIVGDYTYYDDPVDPEGFERNVLYHFPFINDKLIIGKFCALARDVTFIMNGANHSLRGFSTYPFAVFGGGWESAAPSAEELSDGSFKGDTVVENDVWIGYDALIMPGVRIGNGAVIGARAVVTKDVPPYTIVGGNPAAVIRPRFEPEVVALLQRAQWWDWPIERITHHLSVLTGNDPAALRRALDDRD